MITRYRLEMPTRVRTDVTTLGGLIEYEWPEGEVEPSSEREEYALELAAKLGLAERVEVSNNEDK